ncbi:carbohydrate esterase [Microcystis phage Mwe-JY07]
MNVDPGATGSPLVLQPGQTAVKARSILTALGTTARPAVAELCALTCVSSAPAANSFRPGFARADKGTFDVSAINLAALPNLSAAGISVPAYATALSWLSQIHTHQHTYNVLSRNIVPAIPGASSPANDVYAGTFMERFGEIALGLCLNVWTTPQKTELARRLVQHAIDIEARAAEGGIWQDNGGHAAGRGALLAICALLTGRQSMADMVGQAVVGVMDTPANASPLGTRIWGDVSQHGLITQAIIDTARAMPFTQSQLGWPEFAADAARRSISEPTNWQNSLGAAQPTDLKQAYRHVATAVNVPFGLALRLISGGQSLFNSQVFFDYLDRHMQVRIVAGATLPDATGNDIAAWVIQAWQAHRGTSGLWQPPSTPVAPSNTVLPSISGDANVGSVLTSTPGDWAGTAPITLTYQWRRDGGVISGETGTTYTLVSGDVGATITLAVTGTNTAGSSAPAISNGLGPVTTEATPATPLAGTRSIAFGPRNGDGFQNRLAGPQLTNLFGTGSAGAAGAFAVRVRIQPGGLNSNSGATTQTIVVPMLGTGGTTTSRGVHAGFGSYGTSFAGLRGRFYFLGRDQAGANYIGDRDTAGNPGSTGSARYLRSPQITPNAQGSWTGLVILRRDGAGQFQVLLVTADGTLQPRNLSCRRSRSRQPRSRQGSHRLRGPRRARDRHGNACAGPCADAGRNAARGLDPRDRRRHDGPRGDDPSRRACGRSGDRVSPRG